jgi:hypothetical protein
MYGTTYAYLVACTVGYNRRLAYQRYNSTSSFHFAIASIQ